MGMSSLRNGDQKLESIFLEFGYLKSKNSNSRKQNKNPLPQGIPDQPSHFEHTGVQQLCNFTRCTKYIVPPQVASWWAVAGLFPHPIPNDLSPPPEGPIYGNWQPPATLVPPHFHLTHTLPNPVPCIWAAPHLQWHICQQTQPQASTNRHMHTTIVSEHMNRQTHRET